MIVLKQYVAGGIELLKKIKNSISAKFFLFTFTMLFLVSIGIYLFISLTMPIAYEKYTKNQVTTKINQFKNNLTNSNLSSINESLDSFSSKNSFSIFLFNNKGTTLNVIIPESFSSSLPSAISVSKDVIYDYVTTPYTVNYDRSYLSTLSTLYEYMSFYEALTGEKLTEELFLKQFQYNKILVSNENSAYDYTKFSINLSNGQQLTCYVIYTTKSIKDSQNVLIKLLPYIIVAILLISIISSLIYSKTISTPLINMSVAARDMANMNLEIRCEHKATDEIGSLANSLNYLATNLNSTLNDLKFKNKLLSEDIEREIKIEQKRTDFFRMASHELKTPITILKGQTEGMLYNIGNYKDRDLYLQRSLTTIENMEQLVYELINSSKLDDKNYNMTKEDFIFEEVIPKIINETEQFIVDKHLDIQVSLNYKSTITANKILLKRALLNIIKNAIIYSPDDGTIILTESVKQNELSFSVSNQCPPISKDDLSHIFEPFYRVDKSRARSTGGSGLGLHIVKSILEAHNYKYSFENTSDGVIFTVFINL